MNLSRRSFLFGTTASLIGAGAVLGGCNHKIGDKQTGHTDSIKVGVVDYFDKFDYAGTTNPTIAAIGWHIFEGLYDINPRSNETYPALAKAKPVKIDDLTYEVELRENAKFSNDAIVMAGDIVYSFKAAKQKNSIKDLIEDIDDVVAAGSNKVQIKLKRPIIGVLEERLSLVKIEPASGSEIDKQTAPVGTGPYLINKMEGSIGGEIEFVPNSNYNGRLDMPQNSMHWTINPDSDSRVGGIKGGAFYIAEDIPVDKIYELRDGGNNVEFVEGFENAFFFFKTTKAPFNKKEVRQAVYYAVDTNRIIEECLKGHGSASTCFLGSTNKNYHQASTVYKHDVDKAKELLAKNNVINPTVNFVVDKNCWAYKFRDIIVENLAEVGINCHVDETEFRWTDLDDKLKNKDFDFCMTTIERSLHGRNADLLLHYIYYHSAYLEGRTEYSHAENNRYGEILNLIDLADEATGSDQQKIYNDIFDILADEVPLYPFIHKEQITAFDSKKVSGFTPISTGGIFVLGSELIW